jgi:hypothetical protein
VNDTEPSNFSGLRAIVVMQAVGGALALVPLLYMAAMTYLDSSLSRNFSTPRMAFNTLWQITALATALFNLFGGVALYYKPHRRSILGSLTLSAVLFVSLFFL